MTRNKLSKSKVKINKEEIQRQNVKANEEK